MLQNFNENSTVDLSWLFQQWKSSRYYLHPLHRLSSFQLSGRNPFCGFNNEAADTSVIKAVVMMVQSVH